MQIFLNFEVWYKMSFFAATEETYSQNDCNWHLNEIGNPGICSFARFSLNI